MTASPSRSAGDSESRLERFRSFTVAHPRLVQAKEALMNAIRGAEPNSLIFVFGPVPELQSQRGPSVQGEVRGYRVKIAPQIPLRFGKDVQARLERRNVPTLAAGGHPDSGASLCIAAAA